MKPYGSKRSFDTEPRIKSGRALEKRKGEAEAEEQLAAAEAATAPPGHLIAADSEVAKAIDRVVRCAKCDGRGCDCWVWLECAFCGEQIRVEREPSDGGGAEVVSSCCPTCAGLDA